MQICGLLSQNVKSPQLAGFWRESVLLDWRTESGNNSILPDSTFILQAPTGHVTDRSWIGLFGGRGNWQHHMTRRYCEDFHSANTENEHGTRVGSGLYSRKRDRGTGVDRMTDGQYKLSGCSFSSWAFLLRMGNYTLNLPHSLWAIIKSSFTSVTTEI